MNSAWCMLLWKEWREHRWMLATLAAAFIAVPLVASVRSPDNFFAAVTMTLFVVPAIGIFLAMHIAAREQSTGTIRFLQALPTTGGKPAAAKLLWAALTILTPTALAVGAAALWSWLHNDELMEAAVKWDVSTFGGFPHVDNWYAARFAAAAVAGVSILLWMAAAGVNRSDEIRAGAIGFLVVISVWAALALAAYQIERSAGPGVADRRLAPLLAAAPGGFGNALGAAADGLTWVVLIVAIVSHLALAALYIVRFGRMAGGRAEAISQPVQLIDRGWLAPPRRSPVNAIAWKQARESLPLAALGAGAIVAFTLIIAWIVRVQDAPMSPSELVGLVVSIWMMVGLGVSIVAGVGVFMDDLRPGIHTFWRSRPISVNKWFAIKFGSGLVITLATLAAGALVIAAYAAMVHGVTIFRAQAHDDSPILMFGFGLLLQLGLFSAAVAAMTLIRQPVYAAVAAIAVVGLGFAMVVAILIQLGGPTAHTRPVAAIGLSAVTIATVITLAWLAVLKDWGWKR